MRDGNNSMDRYRLTFDCQHHDACLTDDRGEKHQKQKEGVRR